MELCLYYVYSYHVVIYQYIKNCDNDCNFDKGYDGLWKRKPLIN